MSVFSWTPQDDVLRSVLEVLRESFVPDTEIQRTVQQKIALLYNCPDFINYLLYVLTKADLYSEDVRAIGGIILKNYIYVTYESLPAELLQLIKAELLKLLTDNSRDVRVSATSIINAIVCKGGLQNWPEIVPVLTELVDSQSEQVCESALITLFKISEDYLNNLDPDQYLNQSIKELLIKFSNLIISDCLVIKTNAIKLMNIALEDHYDCIKGDFDSEAYLTKLFLIVDDDSLEVQKTACQAFVALLDNKDAAILQQIYYAIETMLRKTQHANDDVALQACEFWHSCSDLPNCRNLLKPFVEQLLPLLLTNMRYSDYELSNLKDLLGAENVKPFSMHQARDDENNYEFMDVVDEPNIGWTLRKCSASSLDALSLKLREDMLPTLLVSIEECLNSDDALRKEAAILALGAVAEGCMEGLKPYLSELVTYLTACLNEDNPLIKVITCWTLSRYMRWIVASEPDESYFAPIMLNLMKHFLDANKRVQRAALSAFCVFEEEAGLKLVTHVEVIMAAFLEAFNQCRFSSYYLLYDAVGVLAQSVGTYLGDYAEQLTQLLVLKFNEFGDYCDDQFLALMQCISHVVTAIEVRFLPYSEVVYSRCLFIINDTLQKAALHAKSPEEFDPPDKEPMCGAYDMILAMAIGLKNHFVKFATNSDLVAKLYHTMQDEMPEIRQTALALYGELIRLCFYNLTDVDTYVLVIIENLDKRFEGVCNNAAWVVGKLCTAPGNYVEPHADDIIKHFLDILAESNGSKAVYQTVAISLCTLGFICPALVAPRLGLFLQPACQAMRNVRDCEEKELGFRGLCELIVHNPPALPASFIYFCDAVASWNNIAIDLKQKIQSILFLFKEQCDTNDWLQIYEQFPPLLKFRLNHLYGI